MKMISWLEIKLGDASIHEGNLFVLFVLSLWDLLNHGTSHHILDTIGEPLMSRDAPKWFHNVQTYTARVIEFWIILSLKTQKNQNKNT
jgi:hypothetical protein